MSSLESKAYTFPDAVADDDLWFACRELSVLGDEDCRAALEKVVSPSGVKVFEATQDTHLKLLRLAVSLRLHTGLRFTVVDLAYPEPRYLNDMAPPKVLLPDASEFSFRPLSNALSRVRTAGFLIARNVDILSDEDANILAEAIRKRAIHTRGSMSFLTVFTSVVDVCPQLRTVVCK